MTLFRTALALLAGAVAAAAGAAAALCLLAGGALLALRRQRRRTAGDSGNPRFLVLGNQIVLLHLLWYGGAGAGSFVTLWRDEIQAAMNELAAGYQLETIDLSTFLAPDQQ